MAVRTGVAILAMAVHLSIPVLHNVGGFLQSIAIALLMGLYAFSALMILLNLVAYHFPYSKDYVNPPTAPPEQSPAHTGIQKNIIDQTPACNTSSTSPAGAVVKKPP